MLDLRTLVNIPCRVFKHVRISARLLSFLLPSFIRVLFSLSERHTFNRVINERVLCLLWVDLCLAVQSLILIMCPKPIVQRLILVIQLKHGLGRVLSLVSILEVLDQENDSQDALGYEVIDDSDNHY